MKKIIFITIGLLLLTSLAFAEAPQSWRQAVKAGEDGHEDLIDGIEIIKEIENFRFTNTSNVDLSLGEARNGINKCDAAIAAFKRAKSHYGTAIRRWTYFLDHHYEDQSNRDIARESRSAAKRNVEDCNDSLDWLNRKKKWLEDCYDNFEVKHNQEEEEEQWEQDYKFNIPNNSSIPSVNASDFKLLIFDYSSDTWVIKSALPVVVIFYCPGQLFSNNYIKRMETLQSEFQGKINFYKVNYWTDEDLFDQLEVQNMPFTYIAIKPESFTYIEGGVSIDTLRNYFKSITE